MAENAKTIRVAIEIDRAGAQTARNFVADLTRDVNKLIDSAQRATQAMGGVAGPAVTNTPTGTGGAGTARVAPPGMAGVKAYTNRPGGILGAAAGAIGQGAQELRGAVSGTAQSFQAVQAGLSGFVSKAVSDVERLTRAVERLQRGLGGAAGAAPGRRGGGGGGGSLDDYLAAMYPARRGGEAGGPLGYRPGRIPGYRDETTTDLELLEEEGVYHPGRGGAGGRRGGLAAAAARAGGAGSPFGALIGNQVQGTFNQLGIPGGGMLGRWFTGGGAAGGPGFWGAAGGPTAFSGTMMGGAALGLAGVAGLQLGGKAFEGQYSAQLDWQRLEPLRRMERAAALAAPARQAVQAAYGGDITYLRAQRQAMQNPNLRASLLDQTLTRESIMAAMGERDFSPTGAAKSVYRQKIEPFVGRKFGDLARWFQSKAGNEALAKSGVDASEFQYKVSKAILDQQPELAGMFERATQANVALTDPVRAMAQNEVYQQALGRVSLQRLGALGGGQYRLPNGQVGDRMLDLEARLTRAGFTTGEYAGARRQIGTTAGVGYLGKLGGTEMLSMEAGFLQGAPQLLRAGGILGGSAGAGRRFLDTAVQGSVGQHGLDVTVGSELFGAQTQRALQLGQFGAGDTFENYAQGLAGFVAGGGDTLDVAQQQRRALQLQQGQEGYASFFTGRAAPLYQALAQVNSIDAAGGYGYGSEALARLDPTVLQGVARGGDLPEELAGLGITRDQAVHYYQRQQGAIGLAEVTNRELKEGSAAKELVESIQGRQRVGGTYVDVLRDRMERATPEALDRRRGESAKGFEERRNLAAAQARQAQLNKDLGVLGALRAGQGLAKSAQEGAGFWAAGLTGDVTLAPYLFRAKGAHGAGPAGLDKTALTSQGSNIRAKSEVIGRYQDELHRDFQTPEAREAGRAGVAAAGTTLNDYTATTVATAVNRVAEQLDILADRLAGVNKRIGGSAPAPVKAGVRAP